MESLLFLAASLGFIVFGLFLSVLICCIVSKDIRKAVISELTGE